jgi:hypothetical protein
MPLSALALGGISPCPADNEWLPCTLNNVQLFHYALTPQRKSRVVSLGMSIGRSWSRVSVFA